MIELSTGTLEDIETIKLYTQKSSPMCLDAPQKDSILWVMPACYFTYVELREIGMECSMELVGIAPAGAENQVTLTMPGYRASRYKQCHDELAAARIYVLLRPLSLSNELN
ncbi:hypothetical protein [Sorangium sp. So ce388]|uniref:hypothetical protein n=1 Tax=Sorangium sp. So ce388 TaxID=3133309 RepID=UPI003F5C182E